MRRTWRRRCRLQQTTAWNRLVETRPGCRVRRCLRPGREFDGEVETKSMKIAQIAPLHERVPPRLYGGTERVVSYLTEELVRRGHQVTLFASGDAGTSAELVPRCGQALRLDPKVRATLPYHVVQLEQVRARANAF